MNENSSTAEKPDLSLKQSEPPIPKDDPWKHDALQRKPIAANLTNLIRDQKNPLVVSVSGDWGTGKTFLLRHWQAQLEKEGFRAIYFNAWEDDFCDDPFVAIIGQLAEYFSEDKDIKDITALLLEIKEKAKPLFMSMIEKKYGVPLSELKDKVLEEYSDQRKSKDQLKERLKELSKKVRELSEKVPEKHKFPLVFIIDELDRCRPTFAVELLERVKHVFDVPGIVFIFGLNRGELGKSVQSLYGEIDADIYLRRFFDMEFRLPEADATAFCEYLIDQRYKLDRFYREGVQGLTDFKIIFPGFLGLIDLSLRDMDYCIRTMAFVGKNLGKGNWMHPYLLAALIPLKLKDPPLYQKFIQGECPGAAVVDCIDGWIGDKDRRVSLDGGYSLRYYLDLMELSLYRTWGQEDIGNNSHLAMAIQQLQLLAKGESVTHPQYLSKRAQKLGQERANELWSTGFGGGRDFSGFLRIEEVVKLIELTKPPQDR